MCLPEGAQWRVVMAYRFKLGEPTGKGVRRIALEQLDRARASLDGGMEPALAVHDARKCLKRSRALLRLVRPALGEREFKAQAHRLRDIALLLSGARDAHVACMMLATLETLYPLADAGDLETLRSHLAGKEGAEDASAVSPKVLAQALAALGEAREAIDTIEITGRGFEPLAHGLARSFAEFHMVLDRIHPGSHDEDFHDLRKHAQIHWRHMLLLRRAWPEAMTLRASLASALSDRLGDDHDLSVLRAKASAIGLDPQLRDALEAAIADRQSSLRERAMIEARRLALDKPRGLSRRIAGYWRTARGLRALAAKESRAAASHRSMDVAVPAEVVKPPAPAATPKASSRGRNGPLPRRSRRAPRATA